MSKARGIAIIGLDGRFPGASDVETFWQNLKNGVESVSFLTDEDMVHSGIDAELLLNPNYVKARSLLDDVDLFDAEFFGFSPKEAENMDPQHRLFLETAWKAMENAGYDGEKYDGAIGVFAGCYLDTYLLANLCSDREFIEELLSFRKVGAFQTFLGNDKDYLTSRVAYKLNLKGPAITVQTACSTSLVAICQACQSLLHGQCDMALAGGVTVTFPQKKGYLYQEGGMLSPDGHCRAFDAGAQGTVFGSGIGLVVLKRLEEALADGDNIHAVIKGSALNNDGSVKVSYTAPSVDGQAEVIALAQALAGVTADTISYVEAHGTATPLGDPIEIAGLTQAFRQSTDKKGFCAIGSVKTNIGHLDVAAGVAGVIKTTLALKHKLLPPSLHFTQPNSKIDFANSPFYVNTRLTEWETNGTPRRAGVSSFGVGGTNAHVVLEEAPSVEPSGPSRPAQLLVFSARTSSALECAVKNLATRLKSEPASNLADVAFTLQTGRRDFKHRRMLVCRDSIDAVAALEKLDPKRAFTQAQELRDQPVVFMFPGQGAQYVNMGAGLYRSEPVFRHEIHRCAEMLRAELGLDLRDVLYPAPDKASWAEEQLLQTRITQPALFVVEYALAMLWMSWGIKPAAMIGHSVGEYVAGCLAGVFTLGEALRLVAARARLVQEQPRGAMVAVRLSEKDLQPLRSPQLSIAAINSPNLCVVSGPFDAIEAFEKQLGTKGIAGRRLKTSHAFHSAMMDPVLAPFTELLQKTSLKPPQIPYVSNVTGRWVTEAETTDPNYWAGHVRQSVRFADGVTELFKDPQYVLIEVGPGQTLAMLTRQHPGRPAEQSVLVSLDGPGGDEVCSLLTALGRLWLAGVNVDWKGFYTHERRRRVPLPAYPFERKRFWVEPPVRASDNAPVLPSEITRTRTSETQPTSKENLPMPESRTAITPDRQERILATLKTMFHEMSGLDLSSTDTTATFLELGFDSLFLTQARQSLQNKFGVKITYRQLMEDAPSLAALAAYIEQRLPAEDGAPVSGPASPSPPTRAGSETGAPVHEPGNTPATLARADEATPVERIMNQQLQAMSQLIAEQLAVLRNGQADKPAAAGTDEAFGLRPSSGAFQPACPPAFETKRQATAAVHDAGATNGTPRPAEPKPFGPYRPVQRKADGGLTPKQKEWLEKFTTRYTQRTANSKRLAQDHRQCLADPRSIAGFRSLWKELVYQIVVERASGSRLWDIDGNEYLDVTMGFGVNLFGHSPPFVLEAVTEQLKKGVQIGPQSPLAGEVANLIREFTGAERVTFCNTGSEAVMAALRIARTVTNRSKIAFFSGDYHGMFDEVLLRSNNVNGTFRSLPVAPGIPLKAGEEVLILDYGSAESLDILRAHGHELAAVLVEPVQSRQPDLQPREFLHELRSLTEQSGAVLIFDEVITGFRVHPGGAQAMFGVQPDLTTYGKVIGGGFPIGVLAGKARCMDALDGGFWQFGDDSSPEADMTFFAGTFVRHPLALAAAKASLEHLKARGPALQEELNQRTAAMVKTLNAFLEHQGAPIHLMHFGSLFRFHFPPEWPYASLFIYRALEKGVYLREAHQNCFLSTAHTEADIQRFIEVVKESVIELQEAELLPRSCNADCHSSELPTGSRQAADNHDAVPLTESQREIWHAAQLGPEASCAYNESLTVRLQGTLNIEALRGALDDVVARHQALRTVFSRNGDTQRFLPPTAAAFDLPLTDLSALQKIPRQTRLAEIHGRP